MEAIPLDQYLDALEEKKARIVALATTDNRALHVARQIQEHIDATLHAAAQAYNKAEQSGGQGEARIAAPGTAGGRTGMARRPVAWA